MPEVKVDYKKVLLLTLMGFLTLALLLRLGGTTGGLSLLQRADRGFIILALAAEMLRYLGVALSTQLIARFLGRRIELLPTVAATFAGTSINRLLAAGGVGGMYVRYRYLKKNDLSLGSVSIIFLLQYIVSALVLLAALIFGFLYLATHFGVTWRVMVPSALVVAAVLGGIIYLIRLYGERKRLERGLFSLYRKISGFWGRIVRRRFFGEARLRATVNRLYACLRLARNNPLGVLAAFAFGALTLFADILTLYFVFSALGFSIHPGMVVLGYTVSNYAGAISMLPDGILVTDGSLALIYTSLAVPQEAAAMAVLIFRLISYWLPIPLGFLALWILRRRSLL